MKRFALAAGALAALLVSANLGRSGDDKELRAVIDKALTAHGGEANLAKFKAQIIKGDGKSYATGDPIDFNWELTAQNEKQFRLGLDLKIMGLDLKITTVVNGNKGWEKANDDVKEMPADEVAEQNEQMHANQVIGLLPLKNKDYTLASLGDVKVGDQPVVGVRVSKKGHRDVNLFFDKAKGHLVKSEYIVKDLKTSGDKELTQTMLYSDYKEFQGTQQPTRLVMERDGKKFAEMRMSEIQLLETVDNSTFDRP